MASSVVSVHLYPAGGAGIVDCVGVLCHGFASRMPSRTPAFITQYVAQKSRISTITLMASWKITALAISASICCKSIPNVFILVFRFFLRAHFEGGLGGFSADWMGGVAGKFWRFVPGAGILGGVDACRLCAC